MLLSLDISTSCTGYCVFDQNELLHYDYIDLSKHKGMFEKAAEVQTQIKKISNIYNITDVCVEENLQAFRPGLSSAKTLMTLAQFNGVVRWICYEIFAVEVTAINVNSARKAVGLKINRKIKSSTKEQVYDFVKAKNNNSVNDKIKIQWPSKILKSGPNKGQLRIRNEAYDIADAYIIGKAHNLMKI